MQDQIVKQLRQLFKSSLKRILLVVPPEATEEDFNIALALNRRYWAYPPYGAAILARSLKNSGYAAAIVDLNYEILSHVFEKPHEFSYEIWKKALGKSIESFRPDLIGISCMFTMGHMNMKRVAEEVKRLCDLPVAAGGVHPTNAPEAVLRDCPDIDFIGLYECDQSLPALFDVVNGKQPETELSQVAMLIGGDFVSFNERTPPKLDEILPPDYCELAIGKYDGLGQVGTYRFMRENRTAASCLAVRGCRAKCSFCSVRSFNGSGVRTREVVLVVDEVERLVHDYGIKHITWLDDDLLFNEMRATALFNEIIRRKMNLTWDASNGVIAAAITPGLLHAMVESGCIGLNIGIESGSPKILQEVHKPGTVDSFRKAKYLLAAYPYLFIKGFLMMGFPGETLGQMKETVNLALELGFDWYPLQILNPLPSTEIFGSLTQDCGSVIANPGTGGWMAGIFQSLNLRRREENEKANARKFFDRLQGKDLDIVPSKEDLADLWFLMDYKINYEPILDMENPVKLENKRKILRDICDRISHANALGNLFLSLTERKLRSFAEADRRMALAKQFLDESDYWQKRFAVFGLYRHLSGCEAKAV